jgi:hypothetical protein
VGFSLVGHVLAMALYDLAHPVPAPDDVVVVRAKDHQVRESAPLIASAMGVSSQLAHALALATQPSMSAGRVSVYLASVAGSPTPVGFAVRMFVPSSGHILFGAGTRPEHRHHGVYRALVARRIADARSDGAHSVVCPAAEDTSAPILGRLGFRPIGRLGVYESPGT